MPNSDLASAVLQLECSRRMVHRHRPDNGAPKSQALYDAITGVRHAALDTLAGTAAADPMAHLQLAIKHCEAEGVPKDRIHALIQGTEPPSAEPEPAPQPQLDLKRLASGERADEF